MIDNRGPRDGFECLSLVVFRKSRITSTSCLSTLPILSLRVFMGNNINHAADATQMSHEAIGGWRAGFPAVSLSVNQTLCIYQQKLDFTLAPARLERRQFGGGHSANQLSSNLTLPSINAAIICLVGYLKCHQKEMITYSRTQGAV